MVVCRHGSGHMRKAVWVKKVGNPGSMGQRGLLTLALPPTKWGESLNLSEPQLIDRTLVTNLVKT